MNVKKRKKLYGLSCQEELGILKEEISRRNGRSISLNMFKELDNPSVFLCIRCQKLLLKKKRLKTELQEINESIDAKLGLLTEIAPRTRQTTEQETTVQAALLSASPDIIVSLVFF